MEKKVKTSAPAAKSKPPLIETGRLRLRMFEARDFDSAWRLFNDERVQRYYSPANKRTREQTKVTLDNLTKRWRERGFGMWCVGEKSGDAMRGICGFQYLNETPAIEILFAFHETAWGRGFATEAASAALRYGFEILRFEKVFAATHLENAASHRVLEKIGMVFEGKSDVFRNRGGNLFDFAAGLLAGRRFL